MDKAKKLRELFQRHGIIRVMGAHDALGAKLVENTGFDCVWASGFEISTSFGVPDANILTMTDFLNVAVSMNEAVSIPVIADCDTGFGNSNNVIYTVKRYETAGIAAISIEDKCFPKVNSFVPGRQELAPISEFVGKILAAKNSQVGKDFMVIARVEALIAGWGMDEAVKRAHAYADSGADAILIHSKANTYSEISEFVRRWKNKAPLIVIPTTYFRVTVPQLGKMKIKMVIYSNIGIRASIRATKNVFKQIYKDGTTALVEKKIASLKEAFELQGMCEMKESELKYSGSSKEEIVAVIPAAGDHLEEHSMKDLSRDIPISMLDINGKTLLQRQVETLNRCKVYSIYVITGYRSDRICIDGIEIIKNTLYKKTGALFSIMMALERIDQPTFIVYGDVLFEHAIFQRMAESQKDITILVGRMGGSKNYGPEKKIDIVVTRNRSPRTRGLSRVDSIKLVTKTDLVLQAEKAGYEFPGMTFLSLRGVKIFKNVYNRHKGKLEKASLGELLGEIINAGFDVFCTEVDSGWMELHSFADYKLACSLQK